MSHKKKIAACIAFSACLLLAVGSLRYPSTGYSFPPIQEIVSIQAGPIRDYEDGEHRTFDIPNDYLEEVLAALSPSEHNTQPFKMAQRATLEIRAANGQLTYVVLYGSSPGSFSDFSVTHESSIVGHRSRHKYYHGRNMHKLEGILRRALAEAKKSL